MGDVVLLKGWSGREVPLYILSVECARSTLQLVSHAQGTVRNFSATVKINVLGRRLNIMSDDCTEHWTCVAQRMSKVIIAVVAQTSPLVH